MAKIPAVPGPSACPDVVGRAVPGANQAAVLIDTATRQVSAEVAAPARDREVAPASVPDGIAPRAHNVARWEIGNCANPLLCAHRDSFRGPADPARRYRSSAATGRRGDPPASIFFGRKKLPAGHSCQTQRLRWAGIDARFRLPGVLTGGVPVDGHWHQAR